ncbi:DUF6911 family protein [Hydrogenophaga sp. MI9]|uniref:DUF6911 family protein n=1 Tax=Hydrogenophaga sp. MI9 TaxID=3453719 RepID=UPI003EE9EBE3
MDAWVKRMEMMFTENEEYALELRSLSKGEPPPAKAIEHPSWNQIQDEIEKAFTLGGWASLDVRLPSNAYFKKICVYANPGQFRIVVLTRDEDPKNELLEWWHPDDDSFSGMARFGDDDWDSRTIGEDIHFAIDVFHDLYKNGQLSAVTLKNFRSQWNPKPQ